jgi:Chaperone of endosialidase
VGGVWTNASSRELKENIQILSTDDANKALAALSPVRYVYTNSPDEEYVGFIAEDVPELVASNDRKSLSPMDIVAVLTTVTKEQKAEITALRDALAKQEERMLQMEMALAQVLRNQSPENQVTSRN